MHLLPLFLLAVMTRHADPRQDAEPPRPTRLPLPSPEEIAALPADGGPEFNRLVFESSPYLLQHARNPVDWYPWGDEAFERARAEEKPLFLSIGYSTCHWCHVMEHESFEDPEVARLMNEAFVCIKVDREERPDLDHVYMTVTQAMTGHGGWPMTVVMTPDRRPFFAGTYFPKNGRFGRPGMTDLVPQLVHAWEERRGEVLEGADRITDALGKLVAGTPGDALEPSILARAASELGERYDHVHGGFGAAPKFPVPHNLRLLLREWRRTGDVEAVEQVETTLTAMRLGGVWDHVGYGFHRYSTDARWLVPHFEKMLYDQALLAMAYVEGWQATRDPEHERTAREILAYVERDMTSPEGGFFSAEDADSEGEEGRFYVWSTEELRATLGEEDGDWAAEIFRATREGNFRDEASGARTGANILHLERPIAEQARGAGGDAFTARFESVRRRLFEARERRVHPLKDDKVLTDWNGLMIGAFALAARTFDDAGYAGAARRAADHLLEGLRREDGSLHKLERLGEPAGEGLLDDYAFAAFGLLELFETTQEPRWLEAAIELTELMVARFHDAERGGFYLSPADAPDLIVRPKEGYDGAQPSGNSVAASNLLRLGRLTGEERWDELAAGVFDAFAGDVARSPSAHSQMLMAYAFAVGPTREIVVAGDPSSEDTRELLRTLHTAFLPNKVVLLRPPGETPPITRLAPYTLSQVPLESRATVYLCEDFACRAPLLGVDALRSALDLD